MGKIKDTDFFSLIHDFLKYIFPASVNPAPIQLGHIKKH